MAVDTFDNKQFQTPEVEQSEHQSPDLIEVKLHFEPQAAYRVYDEINEQNITKNDDGSFVVTMNLPHDYWLYGYIFSFGSAVEVIEPQDIREEVLRQAEKIINKYTPET